ncbi:C2H2 type zinc finger containing protein [Phlyctema vagabunda]|uniref:C2H2 type zinc finger containing protein n=1 Tax=Phlyctema vagabunda TaxID=108571 RepID=A0ABR4PCZ7_9HELO
MLFIHADPHSKDLIHDERNTSWPFEASKEQAEVHQKTPYDIVKIGLVDYINSKVVQGKVPTDDELLIEARKIFNNLTAFNNSEDSAVSWFNDLILSSGSDAQKERQKELSKFREAESSPAFMDKLKDPHMMIRPCPREAALKKYVDTRIALGLTPTDAELQIEACKILDQSEATANFRCPEAVGWFKFLAKASTSWLEDFRRRANLPRSSEMAFDDIRPADLTSIDYSIHTYGRIERELTDHVHLQSTLGHVPTDKELQDKARLIIYGNDDPWNQTAIDNPMYLELFKRKYGLVPNDETDISLLSEMLPLGNPEQPTSNAKEYHSPQSLHWNLEQIAGSCFDNFKDVPIGDVIQNKPLTNTNPTQPLRYFLNDANCYRRLVRELSRFVTSCMSVNNPNQHVPSDAELQNQARWVIYDDDDPWNQTAADNAEWLIRFKRDVGLAPAELGPGLPASNETWHHKQKGTGFAPPYTFPKAPPAPYEDESNVVINMQEKEMRVKASTANKFLKSLTTRYSRVPTVFCSRELENGLNSYVKSEVAKGLCPTDADLQAKARDILGTTETAADDMQLLEKFKAMNGILKATDTVTSALSKFPESVFVGDLSAEDSALLQQFDTELGHMDFTTSAIETPESEEELQITDYASYHRVNTATASPLRRRVSHIVACKAGYSACAPHLGISPENASQLDNMMDGVGPDSAPCSGSLDDLDFEFDFSLPDPDASTF